MADVVEPGLELSDGFEVAAGQMTRRRREAQLSIPKVAAPFLPPGDAPRPIPLGGADASAPTAGREVGPATARSTHLVLRSIWGSKPPNGT
jgi:hypothetical protein